MYKKYFVLLLIVSALLLSACSDSESKHDNFEHSLPENYSLENYEIAENLNVSCVTDYDCETPINYLILSSCPYTTLCLDGFCNVVCPMYVSS